MSICNSCVYCLITGDSEAVCNAFKVVDLKNKEKCEEYMFLKQEEYLNNQKELEKKVFIDPNKSIKELKKDLVFSLLKLKRDFIFKKIIYENFKFRYYSDEWIIVLNSSYLCTLYTRFFKFFITLKNFDEEIKIEIFTKFLENIGLVYTDEIKNKFFKNEFLDFLKILLKCSRVDINDDIKNIFPEDFIVLNSFNSQQ